MMQISGKVISVARQWWMKINTKPVRIRGMDGAAFPHAIKVRFVVNGEAFTKRKWIGAGKTVPSVGAEVTIICNDRNPRKVTII